MEDLKTFKTFYSVIRGIYTVIFVFALLACGGAFFNGNYDYGILIAVTSTALWFVMMFLVKLQEIMVTRFIAMTENVLEITEMLEKKFNINQ